LIEVCGNPNQKDAVQQETSILSKSNNGGNQIDDDNFLGENMIEDTSRESSSRIALEEQRHRHKISNPNSNFYKFR